MPLNVRRSFSTTKGALVPPKLRTSRSLSLTAPDILLGSPDTSTVKGSPFKRSLTAPDRLFGSTSRRLRSSDNTTNSRLRVKRTISAGRDATYLNILCTENLVSTENILDSLEVAQGNIHKHSKETKITKLELEDVVGRNEGLIHQAIYELLTNYTKGRNWKWIKFTDCIRVLPGDVKRVLAQLKWYASKQRELWALLHDAQPELPLSFRVKLEIDEGVSLDSLLSILQLLKKTSLGPASFGGALYGCKASVIPYQLATLFQKKSQKEDTDPPTSNPLQSPSPKENEFQLGETILMDVIYSGPSKDRSTANSSKVLAKCIDKLLEFKNSNGAIPTPTTNRRSSRKQRNCAANLRVRRTQSAGVSLSKTSATARIQGKMAGEKKAQKNRRGTVPIVQASKGNLKLLKKETKQWDAALSA